MRGDSSKSPKEVKMVTDKSNILCILKVLQEYSDEDNILSIKDIRMHLKNNYDIEPDRRTIYGAINALNEFGYDISGYEENGKGYFLRVRDFDAAEMRLLIDAVYSCEYISQKQTKALLEKLRGFLSAGQRKSFTYTNIISAEKKSPNADVFLNIEILEEAINEGKMVSFTYMDYDYDKSLKPRREKKYVVNPYSMICDNERYYLVLIYKGQTEPSFYRIDMMKDIEILEEKIEISKRNAKLDSAKKVVYAHSGEQEMIKIRGDKTALRYVIEDFGSDTIISKPESDGSFTASFKTSVQGFIYWALQYMQHVEVLEPKHLRDEITEIINGKNKYNHG